MRLPGGIGARLHVKSSMTAIRKQRSSKPR